MAVNVWDVRNCRLRYQFWDWDLTNDVLLTSFLASERALRQIAQGRTGFAITAIRHQIAVEGRHQVWASKPIRPCRNVTRNRTKSELVLSSRIVVRILKALAYAKSPSEIWVPAGYESVASRRLFISCRRCLPECFHFAFECNQVHWSLNLSSKPFSVFCIIVFKNTLCTLCKIFKLDSRMKETRAKLRSNGTEQRYDESFLRN